jgi:hypothetical protein
MKFKLILLIFGCFVINNWIYCQNNIYVLDSCKMTGCVVVDEIKNELWFFDGGFNINYSKMNYGRFQRQMKKHGLKLLSPSLVESFTIFSVQEAMRKWLPHGIVTKLHRKNNDNHKVLYCKKGNMCYLSLYQIDICAIIIEKDILPKVLRSKFVNGPYQICYMIANVR